jgi:hypothetical protein
MTTYTFQKVRLNGKNGWIATRYINSIHAGKQFGITKKQAIAAFEE